MAGINVTGRMQEFLSAGLTFRLAIDSSAGSGADSERCCSVRNAILFTVPVPRGEGKQAQTPNHTNDMFGLCSFFKVPVLVLLSLRVLFRSFCLQSKKGPCRRNDKKTHLFFSSNSNIHLFLLHHLRAYQHWCMFSLPSSSPRAPDVTQRGCAPALTDRSIKKWPPCPCVKPNIDSAGALRVRNVGMCT